MKKSICLLLVFSAFFRFAQAQYCGNSGSGQCSATPLSSAGFFPPEESLAPLINGENSSTVIQFQNFDTITFGGHTLTIDSLHFDTISNLPAGLCWSSNSADNTFMNQENGCIRINGTTCAPPGQYRLYIIMTAYVPFGISTNADAAGLIYRLRVNNLGEATIAIDTSQSLTNPFIPYGPAANCSLNLTVAAGGNTTVCSGSNIILDPGAAGGQPPYSFAWSASGQALNCPNCQNPAVTLTQSSAYTVTVTDAANATATATYQYTVSGSGSIPQLSASNSNYTCNASFDTTTLTITGGSSPFNVTWGNGASTANAGNTVTNLYTAGTFVITAQDANGCLNSAINTVAFTGVNVTLTQAVPPTCPHQNTGQLAVNVSGGTAPYSYSWSNGATTSSISNIASGSYVLRVTDVNNCSAESAQYLRPSNDIYYYVYLNETDANCSNNGSVSTQVYGGTGSDVYTWSNGATSATVTNLTGSTYTVTVTDSIGCVTTGTARVNTNCFSIISGYLFNDLNSNCILDNGESGYGNMYISATGNGGEYFGYTDNTGFYSIHVYDTGSYTLSANNYYWGGTQACDNLTLCGNSNSTVTIAVNGDTSANNNYALSSSGGFDLTMHPGWTPANPGFDKEYWIMPFCASALPFTGQATIVFKYDSNLIYNNSNSPQPIHDPIAHTLTWTVDSIPHPYYNWFNFRFENFFTVPVSLPLGYLLQSDFTITPTSGDCDSSNNHLHFSETVTGSHDPNEKDVEPAYNIPQNDSVLTYTIHFQNTGTDSTHFIIITDSLSANLNPASVRNLASSSPYSKFTVSGKGILTWTFNPLRLVDSITNPQGSKGFITFQVTKKADLPIGTSISNTAYVYFDYNDAVVTNTVTDTISRPTYIFEVPEGSKVSVRAFPNPFNSLTNIVVTGVNQKFDFEMYDITGRLSKRVTSIQNNQFEVTRDNMATGVYLYRIIVNNQQAAYGKLVVQ